MVEGLKRGGRVPGGLASGFIVVVGVALSRVVLLPPVHGDVCLEEIEELSAVVEDDVRPSESRRRMCPL